MNAALAITLTLAIVYAAGVVTGYKFAHWQVWAWLLLPGVLCAHDADNRELPVVDHVLLTHLHNQYVIFWREYPDAQGQGHVGGWRNRDSSPLDIDQIGHRYRCRFFDRRDNVYREVWSFGLASTDGDNDPEFEDSEVWAWSRRIDLQPKDPSEWDYYEEWD